MESISLDHHLDSRLIQAYFVPYLLRLGGEFLCRSWSLLVIFLRPRRLGRRVGRAMRHYWGDRLNRRPDQY